jgi:hypothetical protein
MFIEMSAIFFVGLLLLSMFLFNVKIKLCCLNKNWLIIIQIIGIKFMVSIWNTYNGGGFMRHIALTDVYLLSKEKYSRFGIFR